MFSAKKSEIGKTAKFPCPLKSPRLKYEKVTGKSSASSPSEHANQPREQISTVEILKKTNDDILATSVIWGPQKITSSPAGLKTAAHTLLESYTCTLDFLVLNNNKGFIRNYCIFCPSVGT